ncbi:unnamed protein product [Lathyrus sativus]|nr:unnamed protein product [Lathyrus sativus]
MIIGSLNIRGGGNISKRRRIIKIITSGKAEVFFIQESKVKSIDIVVIKILWNCCDIGWSYSKAHGFSRVIITIWKEQFVQTSFSFSGKMYHGTKVEWNSDIFHLVNIYSTCDILSKRKLWKESIEFKNKFTNGAWIMGGYFNAISKSSERKGRSLSNRISETREFEAFIF